MALLLLFACSRNPLVPVSGEFVFQETWGKDYYTTSRDIGPGHGDGTSGSEIGAFNTPTALALHQAGILVLDSGNRRVQKFSFAGAPESFSDQAAPAVELNCLGSEGYDAGEFLDPSDMCVNSAGDIIVADRENFCVQVFDPSGNLISRLARILNGRPAATNAPGGFIRPVSAAVDAAGNLFVLDTAKSTVDRFSNTLNIDSSWQAGGSLYRAAFASAVDMEYHEGFLYILCPTKLLQFGPSGTLVRETDLGGYGPDRLASGRKLSVCEDMFAVSDGNYLKFFNTGWDFLFSIGGLTGDRDAEFDLPAGAVLSGDTLYVADSANNRIQVFSRR